MKKKCIVTLTDEECRYPEDIVNKGKNTAYRIKHADILPNAESDKPDNEIAAICRCRSNTAADVRRRSVGEGTEAAPGRKKREKPPIQAEPDGEKEARLIATACSLPPDGHAEGRMVGLKITDSLSDPTVRRALKKTNSVLIFAGNG